MHTGVIRQGPKNRRQCCVIYAQYYYYFFPDFSPLFSWWAHNVISRDSSGLHRCRATQQAYRSGLCILRSPCHSQSRNRGPVHLVLAGCRHCRLGSTQGSVQTWWGSAPWWPHSQSSSLCCWPPCRLLRCSASPPERPPHLHRLCWWGAQGHHLPIWPSQRIW